MLIYHKGHTDTIQVYSVTVMTHVKALQAGHSSQGTSEPITPALHRPAFTTFGVVVFGGWLPQVFVFIRIGITLCVHIVCFDSN